MLASTVDSEQMRHYLASYMGLHCLPIIPLRVPVFTGFS